MRFIRIRKTINIRSIWILNLTCREMSLVKQLTKGVMTETTLEIDLFLQDTCPQSFHQEDAKKVHCRTKCRKCPGKSIQYTTNEYIIYTCK